LRATSEITRLLTNYATTMKEVFILYLWENKLLFPNLLTTDKQPITILHPGTTNLDAGPDFLNARLKIGDTLWAGNVEIHVNASDWYKHRHDADKAYDNVVLHVVYEADKQIYDSSQKAIPTLEIKKYFNTSILLRYRDFIDSRRWIACENMLDKVQRFTWLSWLDRLIAERLEIKTAQIFDLLSASGNDWEVCFYQLLVKNFGFKVNQLPFEQLARMLPLKILLKHRDQLFQLEALLYGVAGLLEGDFKDEYPKSLKNEFKFLAKKYELKIMEASQWRFMRMRPVNFPTIRIAQLAALIHKHGNLFSEIRYAQSSAQIVKLLKVEASAYWTNHFQFDKLSEGKIKKIGDDAISLILINTVVQSIFAYGKYHSDLSMQEKALILLEELEPENNSLIRKFEKAGFSASNALHTQSLIYMHQSYCKPKRCLECRIGHVLLKNF